MENVILNYFKNSICIFYKSELPEGIVHFYHFDKKISIQSFHRKDIGTIPRETAFFI